MGHFLVPDKKTTLIKDDFRYITGSLVGITSDVPIRQTRSIYLNISTHLFALVNDLDDVGADLLQLLQH